MNKKPVVIFLMSVSVAIWGLEFVVAKNALETIDAIPLIFYKYLVALVFVFFVWLVKERGMRFRIRDLGPLLVSMGLGEILFFVSEYAAMDFIPVSLISIILAFVPVVSLVIERVLYKRRPGKKAVLGVAACIAGVVLIIGVDWQTLFQGRVFGYLLAFVSVMAWNIFNFATASLHERYSTITLTFNQILCLCILLFPFVIRSPLPPSFFSLPTIAGILYLGLLCGGVTFLITVRSLHVLGPTITALFSNFLPVTTTFFGWIILGEMIAPLQFVGGAIVIAAGYVVIKEMGKMGR